MNIAQLNNLVTFIGKERLDHALAIGGVVFVSAHLGDWERLLTLHNVIDQEVLILSKRFTHRFAQQLWDASRKNAPTRLDRGARAKQLIQHLRAGGCVADVIDQHDPRPKARRLPFFGIDAATSPDVVTLAERGEAAILPILTSLTALPTSNVTVPSFALGIIPLGPKIRTNLLTELIMSGVAMALSNSSQPF